MHVPVVAPPLVEMYRVVVAVPSIMAFEPTVATFPAFRGVVVPTPRNGIVVVARDEVAVTISRAVPRLVVVVALVAWSVVANSVVEVALVEVALVTSKFVEEALTVLRLLIVELAALTHIAPGNLARPLT